MASFSLDLGTIKSNTEGWGPTGNIEKFDDIPYAPFSKSEKIGKCSDFNSNMKQYQRQNIYGANASNPFTFKLDEDEDSFQLVDYSRPSANKGQYKQGRRQLGGGQQQQQQRGFYGQRQGGRVILDRHSGRGSHGGRKQGGNRYNNRYHWNDRRQKNRESSIEIGADWELKEEIDLTVLKQYVIEVIPQSELIATCGAVRYYNKDIERVNARDERKLQRTDKEIPLISTSDDKVIRTNFKFANVYATDEIMSTLMTANRSVYSWDIVVIRIGGKIFFEHRPGTTNTLTVNETSNSHYDDKDPVNSASALSNEAAEVNINYWQQVLTNDEPHKFETQLDEEEYENCVPVGYRYMKWNLGDDITVLARTEVDGCYVDKDQTTKFVSIKATNEFDKRDQSTDFRKNIDNQRASVLANEMKNNSTKFAKWSIQSTLAGVETMNLGYVSRYYQGDPTNHVVLASQNYSVSSLNSQNRVDMRNTWGIFKRIVQSCMKLPNGKYLLHRDPNRAVVNIYAVPENAFDPEEEEVQEEEEETQNKGWAQSTR
ncbi:eIF-3 zeta [Heterostelium album PN500]|uniref:Eukaryotic translation initiation factor 3 subunit D n=1 Tax=Heterostelium pallidum (strain ATCC 26659 / Pp 5 / PN500) TaxID=670386 RepID=D3B418_HETP5|nr:eIF-3 zeta [Heterostelium album PN500]EFA84066.1 eIF-3 zeta [Heterostelium album PN500]|eukprot:XP_020436183.1 eIF-3 zeta [Heterostelium album PN500]